MATNVTEKDKTLHEVIDFLQKEWDAANNASDNPDEEVYDFYDGMTTAYEHVINYWPSHARLFRHHAFRGTQSKRGREGIVMWFKRRRNEYGCPMCGRLPVIKASQTEKYHESRKVRTTLTVYRLQCPRGHISTSWFSHAALASRQWKELVDEYKGKDTK
jgi:hypothetical protein